MENTSIRLKKIMKDRNLKQVDILNLTKPICKKYSTRLGKNDLSQYISGKVEPGQRKLFILAEALNVSEGWLMGLDVPMENQIYGNEANRIMTFGFTLFELLRYHKITKEEVADKLNININIIDNAINGSELPSEEQILKIASFFNIQNKNELFDNTVYNKIKDNYFKEKSKPPDELDILFSKHKDILTDEDKEHMKFIIEKRKREIDKQLGEDDK